MVTANQQASQQTSRKHNSSDDMLAMIAQIQKRIQAEIRARITPSGLEMPAKELGLMRTMFAVHKRYERGKYRHSEHEEGQAIELAHWLVNEDAARKGLEPRIFNFNFEAFRLKSDRKPTKGYDFYIQKTFYTNEIADILDDGE